MLERQGRRCRGDARFVAQIGHRFGRSLLNGSATFVKKSIHLREQIPFVE
jgi:hypothetical protein